MQIQIISIGQKMPAWVESGCADYLRRLPREIGVTIVTLPLAPKRSSNSAQRLKEIESRAIMARLTPGSFNIALDEHGNDWGSQKWSQQLQHWMLEYPRVNLIIGGPDGLSRECVQMCQQSVSLGKMTMPHALVRVVLVEQLYRAWTLSQGHPYHRE